MEKCFNCGAAVRPGAKFCTSCGTRLVDNSAPTTPAQPQAEAWSQTTPTEETQVATPAAGSGPRETANPGQETSSFASWNSGWEPDKSGSTSASTSPADRFEAGLDTGDSDTDEKDTSGEDRDFGWGKPAPATDDRFASWSAAYGTSTPAEDTPSTDAAPENDSEVVSAERATIADDDTSDAETEPTGFTRDDKQEADDLRGDENIAASGPDSGITADRPLDQSDARQRATTLIEELRELVWKIGEQEPVADGDMTEVRNALSTARGHTSDFSDLERAIAAVRRSPRDIDALVQLGGHAARLEELLESHARLTSALDDAISKMQ